MGNIDKFCDKNEEILNNMTKNSKIVTMAMLGTILEFYDFMLYILMAPIIAENFFKNATPFVGLLEAYGLVAIGYFFRPVGGIILGHFGDKIGRKNTFLCTITLMTISTIIMGSIPNTGSFLVIAPFLLILCRILQGMAIGGEFPGATSFVYEHLSKKKQFLGCSLTQLGSVLGVLCGSGIVALLSWILSRHALLEWGWRIPFLLGGIVGIFGIYLRAHLVETPEFLKLEKAGKVLKYPFVQLFKEYKIELLIFFLLTLIGGTISPIFFTLFPMILNKFLGFSNELANSLGFIMVLSIAFGIFIVPFIIRNHIALKKVMLILYIVLAVAAIPFFQSLKFIDVLTVNIILIVIVGIIYGGIMGIYAFIGVSLFPTNVRFSGVSMALNIAMALGQGLTPIMITLIIKNYKSIYAIPCYIIIYSLLTACVTGFLLYRNKQGKSYYK